MLKPFEKAVDRAYDIPWVHVALVVVYVVCVVTLFYLT